MPEMIKKILRNNIVWIPGTTEQQNSLLTVKKLPDLIESIITASFTNSKYTKE